MAKRPRSPSIAEVALLAAIAESPDDDGPRIVYADAVAERGDVARAELIHLQLARAATGGFPTDHEGLLLSQNERRWLAPITKAMRAPKWSFVRGFLDECELAATPDVASALAGHPLWSTVRHVRLAAGDCSPILVDPVMRNLRIVEPVKTHDGLVPLLATDAPVEVLLRIDHRAMCADPALDRAVRRLEGLPRLRRIVFDSLSPGALPELWSGGLDRPDLTIAIWAPIYQLATWWPVVAAAGAPARAKVTIAGLAVEVCVDQQTKTATATMSTPNVHHGIWELALGLGLDPPRFVPFPPGVISYLVIRPPAASMRALHDATKALYASLVARARELDIEIILHELP